MSKYRLGDLTLKSYNSWDYVPREPASMGAAILNFFSVSGTIAGSTALYVGATYAVSAVVTAVTLNALMPKPDLPSLDGSSGRLINTRNAVASQEYVYGTVRKGGTIVNMKTTGSNNQFLHIHLALCGHEVSQIGDIYINDQIVTISSNIVTSSPWNSKIEILKFTGNNAIDTLMPDSLGVGTGIAYLSIKLEFDQTVFAGGIPTFTAVVSGKKVYDPRQSGQSASDTSTHTFSSNSALCIADYIRADYGLDESNYAQIDDTFLQAAANVCDETVSLSAGGTEKRYECHGVLSASNTPANNLQKMLTSCAGTLFWGAGSWKIKAGAFTTSVKDFTLDDLRSNISINTRTSSRDNFNAVQGTFNDASQDYITVDYPQIESTGLFLFQDNGVENILDLTLPFTTSSTMAQRLAKQTLFRSREQIIVSAEFGLRAFDVQVGDVVRLTADRYGFSNKEFEVQSWSLNPNADAGDMRVSLNLQETSQDAYSWNAEEIAIITNDTTLPTVFNTVPNFGLSTEIETSSFAEKSVKDLVVTISSNNLPAIENIEIQVARTDFTDLINRERLIQSILEAESLFVNTVISGRKLGDITNDGSVTSADAAAYEEYYKRTSTSHDTYINDTLHQHIIDNPTTFNRFLHGNIKFSSEFETFYKGTPQTVRLQDFSAGTYSVRARAFNVYGAASDYTTLSEIQISLSDADIGSPTNLTIENVDIQNLKLNWEPVESSSLSHYEIRHSKLIDGEEIAAGSFVAGNHYVISSVGNTDFTAIGASSNSVGVEFHSIGAGSGTGKATNLVKIDKTLPWTTNVPRPASSAQVGTRAGTYCVSAFSKNGTPSLEFAKASLRTSDINNALTNTTSSSGLAVTGSSISTISYTNSTNPNLPNPIGQYLFAQNIFDKKKLTYTFNKIDLSSSKEARVTFDIDFVRANLATVNSFFTSQANEFDKVFGSFDNLEGLFDELDDEIRSDVQIIPFVRVTQDDPASASATFSEFQRVTSNVYKARGFDLKFEVSSDTYNVSALLNGTPSFTVEH